MKKKLRLQVDDLHVEQFQVERNVSAERGTVHGYDPYDTVNAVTAPCMFCLPMPITYSCEDSGCC